MSRCSALCSSPVSFPSGSVGKKFPHRFRQESKRFVPSVNLAFWTDSKVLGYHPLQTVRNVETCASSSHFGSVPHGRGERVSAADPARVLFPRVQGGGLGRRGPSHGHPRWALARLCSPTQPARLPGPAVWPRTHGGKKRCEARRGATRRNATASRQAAAGSRCLVS